MEKQIAFLYAGQGSQTPGMGKDLYEKYGEFQSIIDSAHLSFSLKEMMFDATMEELSNTSVTQPCLAAFAAGVTKILYNNGVKPSVVAGLSLGEYSALYAAGVFDTKELIELTAYRGKVMEETTRGMDTKMVAVLGLARDTLLQICQSVTDTSDGIVEVANLNCPGQYVIAGHKDAVEQAEILAKGQGAKRVLPLKVSGPFHTSLMKPAGEALKERFKTTTFSDMKVPVFFNATGLKLNKNETIDQLLVQQVQSSVHMEDIIRNMLAQGIRTFVEIGPGKALTGFVKRIRGEEEIQTYSISTAEDLHEVIDALGVN